MKTHDGSNKAGKLYGTSRATKKQLHKAERRTAAQQIAEETRFEPLCLNCKTAFICKCNVDYLTAIAQAESNHLKRVQEFRTAAGYVGTWEEKTSC